MEMRKLVEMFSDQSKAILLISLFVIFMTEVVIYTKVSLNNTEKEINTVNHPASEDVINIVTKDMEQSSYSHENDLEQICVFTENMERAFNYHVWFIRTPFGFNEQEYRDPRLQVALYWKNDEYFFIPSAQCDTELDIEGVKVRVKNSGYIKDGYSFCKLSPPELREETIETDLWGFSDLDIIQADEIRTFKYLGIVEVNTTGSEKPEITELEENGYTDAVLEQLIAAEECDLPKGKYRLYIGNYEYYAFNAISFYAVLQCEDLYMRFLADVRKQEDGSYDAALRGSTGYYEWLFPEVDLEKDEAARRTVKAERLVLEFERK